jgi:hypothetical protein
VLEEDHPFRNLFPGEKPAHLFIANHDGSGRHDLEGAHSRNELWAAMEVALEANYEDGYASALKRLTRLLDSLDGADKTIADLETRHELAVSGGADGKKVKELESSLAEVQRERDELLAAADKVSALKPRPPAPRVSAR